MESNRCRCGNFCHTPGRGCNSCDPLSSEEKAARTAALRKANEEARQNSVKYILELWNHGQGKIRFEDPTTVMVGEYHVGFYPDGSCWFGDISSKNYPELDVMAKDLLARFKGQLTKELYE